MDKNERNNVTAMNEETIDKILDSIFEQLDSMTQGERIILLKTYGIDVVQIENKNQKISSKVKRKPK